MANVNKSQTVTKASATGAALVAAGVDKMIQKCLTAAQTMIQSASEFEKILADTAQVCLQHALDHGDCTKMDKLIKGLPVHPTMTAYKNELVSWVRANSPIRWNAKGEVSLKEDWKAEDFKIEAASDEPFFERPAAKRAREAAGEAHARALKPLTFQDIKGRLLGLRKTVIAATKEDKQGQIRGIAKGEKKPIMELITQVEALVVEEDKETKAA